MKHPRVRGSIAALAILLARAAPAAAQGPIVDGYGGAGSLAGEIDGSGQVAGADTTGSGAPVEGSGANRPATLDQLAAPRAVSGTQLPFTGFDLAMIAGGGLVLMALGVTARWLSRPRRVRPVRTLAAGRGH